MAPDAGSPQPCPGRLCAATSSWSSLVLNDLLQLCLTTTLNVAVGCFDGLTYKQGSTKHAQVGSSVAPLDAVNQVSCRRSTPCASRLARHPSTAQIALGCRLLQRSSTEHPEGSPPPALRSMQKAADLQRRLWELVRCLPHREPCQEKLAPFP